jgi:hypothetical protein
MNTQPCICPKDVQGLRTATDPKCFDHAPWTRHPSSYVIRLRIPARAKRVAAVTLTAAASIAALSAAPAQAASYITVCNATHSEGEIRAYNNSVGYSKTLYPGQCSSTVRDDGGNARVDVDPAGGWIDVDSWTKRKIGGTWPNECFEAENHASDPYSLSSSPYGTDYWVFQYNGCSQA